MREETVSRRKMLNEGSCRKLDLAGTFGKSKWKILSTFGNNREKLKKMNFC